MSYKGIKNKVNDKEQGRGGGMKYAPQALPRRRLLLPALALGGIIFLVGCSKVTYEEHILRGNDFIEKRQFHSAEKEFRKAIRMAPNDAEGHLLLGDALWEQEKKGEAEKEYLEVNRLNPDEAEAHFNGGFEHLGQGRYLQRQQSFEGQYD